MIKTQFQAAFVISLLLGASYLAVEGPRSQAQDTTSPHEPNLMYSCRLECPQAKTNEGVLVCVDQLEKTIGDNGMLQGHPSCYKAVELYQRISQADQHPELSRTG